ncbi:hypothetical protein Vi05172_g5208 [Venturia inaequalis]|nr:hypothetical protein Vi05172_g5208 [Venturia inaequalis]
MPLWDKVWELWYGKKEEKKKEMTIYEVAEARVKKKRENEVLLKRMGVVSGENGGGKDKDRG